MARPLGPLYGSPVEVMAQWNAAVGVSARTRAPRRPSDSFKTEARAARTVKVMAPTFNAIGLAVADMAASLSFYRRLGLRFPAGAEDEPHVEVTVSGGIRLMWDTHASLRSFDPSYYPGPPSGGWAFRCADAAEVDKLHAGLVAAKYSSVKEPWDAPWGQRYAQVHDPDGNVVDLFAQITSPQ